MLNLGVGQSVADVLKCGLRWMAYVIESRRELHFFYRLSPYGPRREGAGDDADEDDGNIEWHIQVVLPPRMAIGTISPRLMMVFHM